MDVHEYPAASEAAAERMVLGRMVLRIEDSGRAVSEGAAAYGAVPGNEARPSAVTDEDQPAGSEGFHIKSIKNGGSAWESNPPEEVLAPHAGFEVREVHQRPRHFRKGVTAKGLKERLLKQASRFG